MKPNTAPRGLRRMPNQVQLPRAVTRQVSVGKAVGSGITAVRQQRVSGNTWPGTGFRGPAMTLSQQASAASNCMSSKLIPKQKEENKGKYTIVFDLDETLVSNRMPGFRPAIRRPHLDYLLKSLKGKAEVVLWTASIESVGKPVLRQIDPNSEYFHSAVYRNPAWFQERLTIPHTKDLRLLGRDLSKTVIIENNPFSVRLNKSNAIMVPDFDRPNPNDSVLRNLDKVLHSLLSSDQPVQQFVTTCPNLSPMRIIKGLHVRLPSTGTDPFYYVGDRCVDLK
eukprot:TRINITY_DN8799_c0_g1_i1.p1 TRINITY_DN8799_c0_g1~~TRINITY_DN8799_c0_g1_i1.p1  ORF type:complete len:323 (+),score=33.29 TRINITY_DN8799_c0_g1_i1:131-970(+)